VGRAVCDRRRRRADALDVRRRRTGSSGLRAGIRCDRSRRYRRRPAPSALAPGV